MHEYHLRVLTDARIASLREEADRRRIATASSSTPDAPEVAGPARDRRASFLARLSRAVLGLEASR